MKRDSQNIGFAVSVASLRRVLPEMLNVERRYGIATGLTLPADGPCRAAGVEPDSPAARADMRAGDVIVKLGARPVPTVADFHMALIGRRAGETLPVEFLRGQQTLAASLAPDRRPKPDGAALLRKKLGLVAAPLAEDEVKSKSLRSPRALAITAVEPGYYASVEHPPEPGDVLARIRKIRPRDLDHAGLILDDLEPGQRVPMVVLRHRDGKATRIDVGFVVPKDSSED
jgi:membrane-associated protease RseP (regulator of RpoE activity)